MKPLSLPVAVVTGSSRRLGAYLAHAVAARGYAVFVHYRGSKSEALQVLDDIRREWPERALGALEGDLSNPEDVARMFAEIDEAAGRLDLLVNNVGQYERKLITEVSPAAWRALIDTNLNGTFYACHHAIPLLRRTRGQIITIGDAGLEHELGDVYATAYRISKHGIRVLTRSLAVALGPEGIRVNMVSPGHLENSVFQPPGLAEATPLRRLGTFEDVAGACAFLLDSPFVTGADIDVGGGYRLSFDSSLG